MLVTTLGDGLTEMEAFVQGAYAKISPLWHPAFPLFSVVILRQANTFDKVPFLREQFNVDGTNAQTLTADAECPDDWEKCYTYLSFTETASCPWTLWIRDCDDRVALTWDFLDVVGAMTYATNGTVQVAWKDFLTGKMVDGVEVVGDDTLPEFNVAFANRFMAHPLALRCRRYKMLRAILALEGMIQRDLLVLKPT